MGELHLPADKVLDAVIVMRRDGTIADWNGHASTTFGWTRDEAVGRLMSDMIIPAEHRPAHAEGLRRYLETGKARVLDRRIEISALDKEGREFPVELSITETQLAGEQVFLGFLRDISERRRAEIALAESEARLGATYNHALVGIAEVDEEGRFLRANDEFCRITGYPLGELTSLTLFDITHPDDLEEDRIRFALLWSGELGADEREKRYVRRDGSVVWIDLVASVVRGTGGARSYGIRVARDITDRKRAEEQQQLLINELNHRVKNTLAVVQSISRQTFRKSAPDALVQAFESRLAALSAAHNLLTEGKWQSARLGALLESVLAPFGSDDCKVELAGPEVLLSPQAAVSFALAAHELATNSVKYGALSQPRGEVHVGWRIQTGRLKWAWQERGGPPVAKPTRQGFGSLMLERALASELGGRVELVFAPHGLRCLIDAPLPGPQDLHLTRGARTGS